MAFNCSAGCFALDFVAGRAAFFFTILCSLF
jgi:hypothetical protein